MPLNRVDTQRAYQSILDRITTLEMAPGAPINDQQLSEELDMALAPVQEALKLLAHDGLVELPPDGMYVAGVDRADLEQLSELRLLLEGYCARQAAQRANEDDLAVLEALRQEQTSLAPEESQRLFEVDHKIHQAIARAAHNAYLAQTLDRYFLLSQRLWYMVLPHLEFLPDAVHKHLELVDAIQQSDPDRAEAIMRDHVQEFYAKVRQVLAELPG